MRNAGLEEAQAGIKIAGRNINHLRYADDTTLMAESEEELKSLLMKLNEESEKIGLKLNIQKTKILASDPITSWQIDGETVETVADFIFLSSKITEDGDCSHEIKRCLLLRREVMTNLDSILKSRDITLPTKVHLVKTMVFPVVMYGCESWTIKKAECQRIEAFELWCWRRLENPLDCKEIQPVHPKGDPAWVFIGRTDVETETPIFWPPDVKSWLTRKYPDAGKDWGQEEKGTTEDEMVGWHHRLNGHGFGWTPGVGDGQGGLACCGSWGHKESDTTEWLNWTELKTNLKDCLFWDHVKWKCQLLSCVQVFVTLSPSLWALQAPLSMGFSRQEHWSRLPCPPSGVLPDPRIEPGSLTLQMDSLPLVVIVQLLNCVWLCDPMACSIPDLLVLHHLLEFAQILLYCIGLLSCWCYPTISPSVAPFSCLQSFPASGSFPMSWLFTSGVQSIGASASAWS